MQLTTNWQTISSAGLISNVTINLQGRYTSQDTAGNYTDTEFRIINYATNSAQWRTTSGTVNFTGAFTDSGSCATYPNYVSNGTVLLSISKRVYHNNDGTKSFNLGGHLDAVLGGTRYNSNPAQTEVVLPKIDRYATFTGATDFNDEQNPTIRYSNPQGNNVTTLEAYIEKQDSSATLVSARPIPKTGNSYTFELTNAERNALRNATPNSNTLAVKFVIYTKLGNDNYYVGEDRTMTIVNANPVVGDNDYTKAETNTKVSTVLDSTSASKVVQNASIVRYTITPTLPKVGSTITSVYVRHNNQTYNTTQSGNSYIVDIPIQNQTVEIYVKDSRGNPTNNAPTKTITIANANFIQYAPVKLGEYSFKRPNATSSNININMDSIYWGVTFRTGVSNVPTIKYKKDDGTFVTIPSTEYTIDSTNHKLTITNYVAQNELPYTSSAVYTIRLEDLLSEAQNTYTVTKGVPTFEAGEYDLKVNGEFYIAGRDGNNAKEIRDLIYPVDSIYLSVNNTNPTYLFGGTWEAFGTGRTLVGVDTSQTEFDTVQKTGGNKNLQNHYHIGRTYSKNYNAGVTVPTGSAYAGSYAPSSDTTSGKWRFATSDIADGELSYLAQTTSAGTGESGNLQPYITVYMWRRTA